MRRWSEVEPNGNGLPVPRQNNEVPRSPSETDFCHDRATRKSLAGDTDSIA